MSELLSEEEKRTMLQKYRAIISKFHTQSQDFEFCNGYILQATRNGLGVKEFGDGMVIYTTKCSGEWVIVACVGNDRARKIIETAKELYGESEMSVVIKNVDKALESELLPECRYYRVDEWWDEQAKYDDNTFPELILNVEATVALSSPAYQSLREEQSRFRKEYSIEVKGTENPDLEKIESLLNAWIDNMHLRNGWNKEELRASHAMFGKPQKELFNYEILDSKSGNLIGFLAFSEISESSLGYNVLINDFSYRNLYRMLMLEGAKIAKDRGYSYLNIQGSEDADQYASKLRLKPERKIFKEHLIYEVAK